MKTIAAVDLKNVEKNTDAHEFHLRFLKNDFTVIYTETGGDLNSAAKALEKWDNRTDALALENIRLPFSIGPENRIAQQEEKIDAIGDFFSAPFSIGRRLHAVCRKWTMDQLHSENGAEFFEDAHVLFTAGMTDAPIAQNLLEYTGSLAFCDPVLSGGLPKILYSMEDLTLYAKYLHPVAEKTGVKKFAGMTFFLDACNTHIVSAAIKTADIVVVPHFRFFEHLENCGIEELEGKIVITAAVSPGRFNFLKQRGVGIIIDTIPKMTETIVGPGVLEAMIMTVSGKDQHALTDRDIINAIAGLSPRVLFPFGKNVRTRQKHAV